MNPMTITVLVILVQEADIHILANRTRAKFEVKNKSFRALSRIFFQKLNMSGLDPLDPDQARQNVGPDLDPNHLSL